MKCAMTGQPLPPRPANRPGRPRLYASAKARLLAHRISEVEALLGDLTSGLGFLPDAASRVRGQFFRLGNLVPVPKGAEPPGPSVPFGIRLPKTLLARLDALEGGTRSEKVQAAVEAYI